VEVLLEVRWFKEWFLVENLKVSSDDFFFQFFNYPLLPGVVKKVTRGKVAIFTSALDIAQTEMKGTVLSKNADEMLNFMTGEEKHIEKVHHHNRHSSDSNLFPKRSSKRSQTLVSKLSSQDQV
jgi:hypothetical protein